MTDDLISRKAALDACQKTADEAKGYGIPQMTMGAHTCRDAIRALPAVQPLVAVKPLEWRVQSCDCQVAESPFGSSAVQNESHVLAPNRWGWWMAGSGEDDSPHGYGSDIEAAKAAAQADYDARILAALTPTPIATSPAPDTGDKLREAARVLLDALGSLDLIEADIVEMFYDRQPMAALSAIAGGDA